MQQTNCNSCQQIKELGPDRRKWGICAFPQSIHHWQPFPARLSGQEAPVNVNEEVRRRRVDILCVCSTDKVLQVSPNPSGRTQKLSSTEDGFRFYCLEFITCDIGTYWMHKFVFYSWVLSRLSSLQCCLSPPGVTVGL